MNYLVIGAGVSGLGAAKLLAHLGHAVTVSNQSSLNKEQKAPFVALGAKVLDGGHQDSHIEGINFVVPSPGLPHDHPLVKLASQRGIPVISEIDLAMSNYAGRVVGVTGTNGKSTTVKMIGHILKAMGLDVSVAGNIGDPPSAQIAEGRAGNIMVLELSSYQLEQSDLIRPEVSVFTSLSADHLAHHGTFESYLAAKMKLVHATSGAAFLCTKAFASLDMRDSNAPKGTEGTNSPAPKLIEVSAELSDLNQQFAIQVCSYLSGEAPSKLRAYLADFEGLPYRMAHSGSIGGRKVINDSKSTNLESTLFALKGAASQCALLTGGEGKGESYSELAHQGSGLSAVIAFGASAKTIAADISSQNEDLLVLIFPTLQNLFENFDTILERSKGTILFSPGCASFDEFKNFEERGTFFDASIRKYLN